MTTTYEWPNLRAAQRGHFARLKKDFAKFKDPKASYRLRNSVIDSTIQIEGNREGLLSFAINFLMASAQRAHLHLYSKTEPGGFAAPFEEGFEMEISHTAELPLLKRPLGEDGLTSFRYTAKPVPASTEPQMLPNSFSWTTLDRESVVRSFAIAGNTPALVSYLRHSLDLADEGTPAGTELRYLPGLQLDAEDSTAFVVRRVS